MVLLWKAENGAALAAAGVCARQHEFRRQRERYEELYSQGIQVTLASFAISFAYASTNANISANAKRGSPCTVLALLIQ